MNVIEKAIDASTCKKDSANQAAAKMMLRHRMRIEPSGNATNFFKIPYRNKHKVLKKVPLIFEYSSVFGTGTDSFNPQTNTTLQ
jgi:hypothetical protein